MHSLRVLTSVRCERSTTWLGLVGPLRAPSEEVSVYSESGQLLILSTCTSGLQKSLRQRLTLFPLTSTSALSPLPASWGLHSPLSL